MQVHQITDNLSSRDRKMQDLPAQRCDRHGGKLIDVYCTTHDVVGCSTCFNIEHSSCKGIQYIPDMTPAMHSSTDISDLETKITQLLAQLDQLKQQKQDKLKLLQQEKDRLLKEIKVLRQKLNDKLDEMENTLVKEVNTTLGMRARDVSKDLDVINNERTSLEKRQKSLRSARKDNHTELFVQLKVGQSLVKEHEHLFKSISTGSNAVNMQVLPSSNVTTLLHTDDAALGSISEILIPKSTTYDRDVNVRLPSDIETCYITDICYTLNGDVYLADHANFCIKKLDESYNVIKHVDLSDSLWGLCEVDNKRLAVTLHFNKKVQFLSQNLMSLEESFPVGDTCFGIDCHDGQLYVCCGGLRKVPGRIEVYSIGGKLLRIYYQGASSPQFVYVSNRRDLLISNDCSERLVTLRMHDNSVSKMQIKALREPAGMFRLSDSMLCVAGWKSHNVVLISEDGEHQHELLSKKDRISKPVAVCFDKQRSRLLVSRFESESIKIFKVTT